MIVNETVTVLRFSKEEEKHILAGTSAAWVFSKGGIDGGNQGDKNADVIHIRIPKENIEKVRVGDLVYVGEHSGEEYNLAECRKITRVSNNKYGTVPHWHIEVGV